MLWWQKTTFNMKNRVRMKRKSAALTGELWGVYCEDFRENWPRYNGTVLKFSITILHIIVSVFVHVALLMTYRHWCNQTRHRRAPSAIIDVLNLTCIHSWFKYSLNFIIPLTNIMGRFTHYGDVIMGTIASQITCLNIVYLTVYSDADKKRIKALRHWPLCGEFTGDRWIPRINGQ